MINLAAKKIGMSRLFYTDGQCIPVTLLEVYEGCVSDFIKNEGEEDTLVLSFDKSENPAKDLTKPVKGVYDKKGIPAYKKNVSFKIAKDSEYKIGDKLGISDIKEGSKVDITGTSIGKGFAGVMKRYNFGGLEASHGVSVSHRSHGSTGQRQDPGKVFKGKKMAGHMGNKKVTIKNLEIVDIIKEDSIICVKGAIPGFKGNNVIIKLKNK